MESSRQSSQTSQSIFQRARVSSFSKILTTDCPQQKLRLFLDWGITFDEPYQIEERVSRKIAYADRDDLIRSIMKKYPLKESLERPRSRVRREAPAREQTASDKMEALHVPNKEDYS